LNRSSNGQLGHTVRYPGTNGADQKDDDGYHIQHFAVKQVTEFTKNGKGHGTGKEIHRKYPAVELYSAKIRNNGWHRRSHYQRI